MATWHLYLELLRKQKRTQSKLRRIESKIDAYQTKFQSYSKLPAVILNHVFSWGKCASVCKSWWKAQISNSQGTFLIPVTQMEWDPDPSMFFKGKNLWVINDWFIIQKDEISFPRSCRGVSVLKEEKEITVGETLRDYSVCFNENGICLVNGFGCLECFQFDLAPIPSLSTPLSLESKIFALTSNRDFVFVCYGDGICVVRRVTISYSNQVFFVFVDPCIELDEKWDQNWLSCNSNRLVWMNPQGKVKVFRQREATHFQYERVFNVFSRQLAKGELFSLSVGLDFIAISSQKQIAIFDFEGKCKKIFSRCGIHPAIAFEILNGHDSNRLVFFHGKKVVIVQIKSS